MRLPVVPVVVVTEVDSMGVPVVVVTEPPADEPCVGPVSPKFLFQRSLSSPDGLVSSMPDDATSRLHLASLGQEFSVTLADVAPYKQLRRISSGHSENTDSELRSGGGLGEEVWSRTDTESLGASGAEDEDSVPDGGMVVGVKKNNGWRTIRHVVRFTPFMNTFRKRHYPWVQLAGHKDSFLCGVGGDGTVLKKATAFSQEERCYTDLMKDPLRDVVPKFHGHKSHADKDYLELECLLSHFNEPCVMDIKMGTRTYLKNEPKNLIPREDLFQKMIDQDYQAPLLEEVKQQAVTKERYLAWRDTKSSSATLGLRIEGTTINGKSSRDYKATCTRDQVSKVLCNFIGHRRNRDMYLDRLKLIQDRCIGSPFFSSHELIGSSLLFVHDDTKASIWMIDFEKTHETTPGVNSSERDDGYLTGLESATDLLSDLLLPNPPSE